MFNELQSKLIDINVLTTKGINPKYKIILDSHPIILQELLGLTNFVNNSTSSSLRERLCCVINNITSIPVCQHCNTNPVKFCNDGRYRNSYRPFCSSKCSNNAESVKNKKEQTLINNYGVSNPSQSNIIHQRKIHTSHEKYGTDYPWQHSDIKSIKEQVLMEKYGVHNIALLPHIQQQIKQTNLRKYGTEFACQSSDIKTKKQQTMLDRYGVENINQSHIPVSVLTNLSDKDWLIQQHYHYQQTLRTISKQLNITDVTVGNYCRKHSIPTMMFPSSTAERDIIDFLADCDVGNIVTNTGTIIAPYELDIFLPEYNLAIEYCGLYWHCSKHERMTTRYHKHKLDECTKKGIRLVTIFEDEWVHQSELVKIKLLNIINKPKDRVYARKCSIVSVDNCTKTQFFNDNHIQGNGPGSINIGLQYNNELVACVSFIKQKNGIFILNRYATRINVVGGFSKLLSHFKKTYNWKQIISFADLRWSQGNVYKINGFVLDKILPPDYEYVDLTNVIRIHKFNFRHKHLPKRLSQYDPNLSETENTKRNQIYKIYNCGLQRWVMNYQE